MRRTITLSITAACAGLLVAATPPEPRPHVVVRGIYGGVPQEILEVWEGSDCTVAVAQDRFGLSIKINSDYGLGSTGAITSSFSYAPNLASFPAFASARRMSAVAGSLTNRSNAP